MNLLTSFNRTNRNNTLAGILFTSVFAICATFVAETETVKAYGFSPLIIGILISILFGNTLIGFIPQKWSIGILFSSKFILRTAIIFYGFRITFQSIALIGTQGLVVSIVMVASTFLLGLLIGNKIFGMDRDLTLLISSGSAVCGAAAVMATESVLKSQSHKSVLAVATVVLFGTLSMFSYPAIYKTGEFKMNETQYGVYIGGSIHEVAQVVAAGNVVSDTAANTGIVVKMTRVMLLAPLLLILGFFIARNNKISGKNAKMFIPYFVFGFIIVAGFNSIHLLPKATVDKINLIDTFLLTMAMCALGMETKFIKFKGLGAKPIFLALILFVWLMCGGILVTKFAALL